MESLVLLVMLIFLTTILIGPIALILAKLGFKYASKLIAIIAVFISINWMTTTIFPVNLVGLIGIGCAIRVFKK